MCKTFLLQQNPACICSCNMCENKKHHLGQTFPKQDNLIKYALKQKEIKPVCSLMMCVPAARSSRCCLQKSLGKKEKALLQGLILH